MTGGRPHPDTIERHAGEELRHGWRVEPFVEGTADDYARLRALFARADYTEPTLCARHGIASLGDFRQLRDGRGTPEPLDDACTLLTRLFLDSETVPWDVVRTRLDADGVAVLERLGLLYTPRGHPELCRGTVLLYPTQRLWIASDVNADHDGEDIPPPVDVVYPAITAGTLRFVALMPRRRCERFVELCSGTAVAALVAARDFADHAWAVDLTARATRFARFNAALNGITRFTALEGDLWAPLEGLTFDRVVAHPPYMPSFETHYVFRDGGEDGEQVTRRIVGGLVRHLEPGGECFLSCMATDRTDAPLERRLRGMLGEGDGDFDLVVAPERTHDPLAFDSAQAREGRIDWASVGRRQAAFAEMGITQLVVGAMHFRRRAVRDAYPVLTERRRLGTATVAEDFGWLLDREARIRVAALAETPARVRPRTAPRVVVRIEHRFADDGWEAPECEIETAAPFAAQMHCPAWFAALLRCCDGATPAPALLRGLQAEGQVPGTATLSEFVTMLLRLVDYGVLEVAEWPFVPRRGGAPG